MAKGIYKRGKVFWVRYAGLDGRIVRESSGSEKFREAESLLISRKEAIKQGKQPEIKKIANHTFNELAGEYLKWAERQRSLKSKAYLIKQLVDAFGSYPLRRFNTMMIEQYQTERIQKGNKPATAYILPVCNGTRTGSIRTEPAGYLDAHYYWGCRPCREIPLPCFELLGFGQFPLIYFLVTRNYIYYLERGEREPSNSYKITPNFISLFPFPCHISCLPELDQFSP
jgi:hypothetical protein